MRKFFSLLVVILTLVTSCSFANNFTDLDATHWAYEPIVEMSERGILNGYPDGTFLPSKSITRAEFAKILVLTLDLNGPATNNVFSDVTQDFWGYEYINIASNYLSGYTNGNEIIFLPNEVAVREDVAVAVVVAAGLQNAEYNIDTLNRFSDKDEISENLRKYIAIAVENNLMQGDANGTFRPKGKLTRAEVCKLMMNTTRELEKIAIADQNQKCTKTDIIMGHKQEYTYKYKNAEKHKIYRKCNTCNVEFYTNDTEHSFIYADRCEYCDYNRDSSVKLSKTKATLNVDEKLVLKVTLSKDSNSKSNIITWSSDNTAVATVNEGTVVAVSEGTATITAQTDNLETGKCKVTIKPKKLEATLYGDINEDGEVDSKDSALFQRYVNQPKETMLTAQSRENADLNLDGEVDQTDLIILDRHLSGWEIKIPCEECTIYGDVNEDWRINLEDVMKLSNYVVAKNIKLSDQAKKNSDVNVDGKVNGTDLSLLTSFVYGGSIIALPAKGIAAYGDVNLNGQLDSSDIAKLEQYLAGSTSLGTQEKKNADFNGDGKINETDVLSLEAYLESQNTNNYIIPLIEPGETVEAPQPLYGDINEDGKIDGRDSIRLLKYINQLDGTILTKQGLKNADLNLDGDVNQTDLLILNRYLAEWDIELPTKGYIVYGDINEDGEINEKDSMKLEQYVDQNDTKVLTAQGKKNADLNADGKINKTDMEILNMYLLDPNMTLPAKEYVANEAT